MHSLRYRITTHATIVITSQLGDPNMVATEKYLPGTSVLGLLAARYIKKTPGLTADQAYRNDHFYDWFLRGKLTVGPAYFVSQDGNGQEQVFLPVPLSIRKAKHAEEIYDFLRHPDDSKIRTKAIDAFCLLDRKTIQTQEVSTSLNFHHERDAETGTTAGAKIFTYESIDSGQTFEGVIFGDNADLQDLLNTCGPDWEAVVGRSKNAQYGEVQIVFLDQAPQLVTMPPRLPAQPGANQSIALSLLSDTMIYNEHGFPSTDACDLEAHLTALLNTPVSIERARAKQADVENFLSIWRLKTPSSACFRMGSSFLLKLTQYDPNTLLEAECRGIGERTSEGFGRCQFGWQTNEPHLQIMKGREVSPAKPEGMPPALTCDILCARISETLLKQAEMLALTDLKGFLKDKRKRPSNSLLGRLEHAVRHSSDQPGFVKFLTDLRKTAKDQLEACHNQERTLLDFLQKKKLTIPEILKISPTCQELNQEFALKIDEDKELERQLYQRYYTTFLVMMRKRTKKEESA